jgi:D-alanyl-D-alanine carboxypeptidase
MRSLRTATRRNAIGLAVGSIVALGLAAGTAPARASAYILVDADSGKVLRAENAGVPWYPASTTKLMTLYVTLAAIRDGRITFDTLFTVSPNAAAQAPVKMGYPVGTQITVDNALKMMMVKSANDMAALIAEGVSGSIDAFAEEMTNTAHSLGMTESSFVNPNGLPADGQIVSARDLAILARSLYRDFGQYDFYWHIPAIRWGKRVVRNYNPLLGRYPGADGMKTGFICASGFNLVATAKRDGKRLIAVVLGSPSGAARAVKAAELLEIGFTQNPLAWLTPSLGQVESLTAIDTTPPDLKDEMCGPRRKRKHSEDEDITASDAANANGTPGDSNQQFSFLLSALKSPTPKNINLLGDLGPVTPILVYTGPTRTDAELAASPPPDLSSDGTPRKKGRRPGARATAKVENPAVATDAKPAAPRPKRPATARAAATAPAGDAGAAPVPKKPKPHPQLAPTAAPKPAQ